MAAQVTGYTKAQASLQRDLVGTGDIQQSPTLNGTVTTATVKLGCIAKQITLQSSGDLAYTYTVSANGQNFATGGTAAANVLSTYNTNSCVVVQITRTSGAGIVTVLASA